MEIGSTLEALNSDQLTDEEVVERVKAGQTALYEIVMRRYNQRLYRVARAILRDHVASESLAGIHVYFPDPWWKMRHRKRRLFTPEFVDQCERVIQAGGRLTLATDVADYFAIITELLARPMINLFFPELSGLVQPLAGIYGGRRSALEQVPYLDARDQCHAPGLPRGGDAAQDERAQEEQQRAHEVGALVRGDLVQLLELVVVAGVRADDRANQHEHRADDQRQTGQRPAEVASVREFEHLHSIAWVVNRWPRARQR